MSVSLQGLDRAWSQPTDTAAIIEGAKKEGELVIYGTTDLRQATILNDKFRQKYPFIDVKLNRLTSDNLYPRLIAETRSGKFLSDVLQNNTLVMYFLKRGKFLAHYLSPEDRYYPTISKTKDIGSPAARTFTSSATTPEPLPATSFQSDGKILLTPVEGKNAAQPERAMVRLDTADHG